MYANPACVSGANSALSAQVFPHLIGQPAIRLHLQRPREEEGIEEVRQPRVEQVRRRVTERVSVRAVRQLRREVRQIERAKILVPAGTGVENGV